MVPIQKRLLAQIFLSIASASVAFIPTARSAPNSAAPAPKDITALLREGVPGMNDATDADSIADLFAPMQVRSIGNGDDTWKRGNPNWLPVLELIRNDIKRDIGPAIEAQHAGACCAMWRHFGDGRGDAL
jgi:hypothetical protein